MNMANKSVAPGSKPCWLNRRREPFGRELRHPSGEFVIGKGPLSAQLLEIGVEHDYATPRAAVRPLLFADDFPLFRRASFVLDTGSWRLPPFAEFVR
jgi:hypothetical protein